MVAGDESASPSCCFMSLLGYYTMRLFLLFLSLLFVLSPFSAQAQNRCRQFPETSQQVCGRLLEYWEQNGGLPVFGYPISEQFGQQVEGRLVQAQLFERNRLELHPENARPYDVLLGRLGADALARANRDWTKLPKADPSAPHYFAQTGHAVPDRFWAYWSSHGLEFDDQAGTSYAESLALFGLPLTEPTVETNPTDGKQYLTQWFERARFEYHPENAGTQYEVLLGLLSAEQAGPQPAPLPSGPTGQIATLLDWVNRTRADAGCSALTYNTTLAQVAQIHTQDMASRDFFSHTGSDGRDSAQRVRDAGYRYRMTAENLIAGIASPEEAVAHWMASPGHRANLLNCDLRETGIGYVDDPNDKLNYGVYWTQVFGTR